MKRKTELVNGQFYHVYNRGVLKSNIFIDNSDYVRFIHDSYEFNDSKDAPKHKVRGDASDLSKSRTQSLVDIVCWCLMPNHFHLLVRQVIDNGIFKFIHKLSTGYAMYFNKKHKRSGILFEGPFKSIIIESDEYLTHLTRYIHLNPVDLVESGWKEKGINNWDAVNKFLEGYRWSSYLDYLGNHNFPSIMNNESIKWYFKSVENYKKFVQSWMKIGRAHV